MADIIQQRRDTATRWAQYNPILLEGEVGYVTDNPNQYKIGNGRDKWNDLPLRGYTGTITQDTGDDENAVMSQKAVTDKLSELGSEVVKNKAKISVLQNTIDGELIVTEIQWSANKNGYISIGGGVQENSNQNMQLMNIVLNGEDYLETTLGHSVSTDAYKWGAFVKASGSLLNLNLCSYNDAEKQGAEIHIVEIPKDAVSVWLYNDMETLTEPVVSLIKKKGNGMADDVKGLKVYVESLGADVTDVKDDILSIDETLNGKKNKISLDWETTKNGYITQGGGIQTNTNAAMQLMSIPLNGEDYLETTLGHSVSTDAYKWGAFVKASGKVYGFCNYNDTSVQGIETHVVEIPKDAVSVWLYNYAKALDVPTVKLIKVEEKGLVEKISTQSVALFDSIAKPIVFSGKKIAAFGDSITYGVCSPMSLNLDHTNGYIYHFAERVGATLDNRALSGTTMAGNDGNSIYNKIKEYGGNADIIWVAGGINDAIKSSELGVFGDNTEDTVYGAMRLICESLKNNHPQATVIFITPIPVTNQSKTGWNIIYPIDSYRKAIYEVATEYGYNVVNGANLGMPTEQGGWNNIMIEDADACHPTAEGHKLYARNLLGKLL